MFVFYDVKIILFYAKSTGVPSMCPERQYNYLRYTSTCRVFLKITSAQFRASRLRMAGNYWVLNKKLKVHKLKTP